MIEPIIFAIVVLITFGIAFKKYKFVYRNIMLGQKGKIEGSSTQRLKNTLLVALGQKKMFKRPIAASLHMVIYVSFMITQIELIEIFIDGFFNQHRFFAPYLGSFYNFIIGFIEVLSLGTFIVTLIFLARRNLLKIPRFVMDEMTGWPKWDGNLILVIELTLLTCIFTMNSADMARASYLADHYGVHINFPVSGLIAPLWGDTISEEALHIAERIGWWGHILIVFGFINYLPYSKHLHIFLAFPNTYYARLNPKGEMKNMDDVQKEVASMFDPDAAFAEPDMDAPMPKFGVSDVFDLEWTDIMAAYTCTECGRCSSVCPANQTGKKLSPRKIMMDVRDRADEIGYNLDENKTELIADEFKESTSVLTAENYSDGKTLFDAITEEELRACTTCNACMEACPVMISPVDIIMELRRNLILEQSKSPEEWNSMFNAMENNGAPWAFSPDDRDKWIAEANA